MSRLPLVPKPFDQATSTATLSSELPTEFQRLVVAIPDEPIEETQLAKEIWALTSVNHADVLLLTLLDDWSRESHIRLQHTLVMQMLATTGVRATSAIVADADWLAALHRTQQPNDLLLCFAEHLVTPHSSQLVISSSRSVSRPVPLSGIVVQQLGQPVHVVNGLLPTSRGRNILLNLLSWLGFAVVIVGSLWMQIRLDQLLHDASSFLRGVVMSGAVILELGLIMFLLRASR